MKNNVFALLAIVPAIFSQSAMASEPYMAANGGFPVTYTGTVDVFKGINLTCNATVVINGPNDNGDGKHAASLPAGYIHSDVANLSVSSIALTGSGGLCEAAVDFVDAGDVSYSAGTVTFNDLDFLTPFTPTGCFGNISATVSTGGVLLLSGTLPGYGASTAPCSFAGPLVPDKAVLFSEPGDLGH